MNGSRNNVWLSWASVWLCQYQCHYFVLSKAHYLHYLTQKLHNRLVTLATELQKAPQMSKQRSQKCFCQHSSSSVARADTREPAALCASLLLTAGWLFLLCWNLITLLCFQSFALLLGGLDLLQRLSGSLVEPVGAPQLTEWLDWLLVNLNDVVGEGYTTELKRGVDSPPARQSHDEEKKAKWPRNEEALFYCLHGCLKAELVKKNEIFSLLMKPL